MDIVDMAYQIIALHEKNLELAEQNALLRQENDGYRADMQASLKSGEQQMAGWLQLLCSDRVKILPEVTP